MNKPIFKELIPKVVLGIAAHMDDLDFGAAGTIAKFVKAGAEIHYLILTDGGKGTADNSITPVELTTIRQHEQQEALKVLGGTEVTFLSYEDGTLENTLELKREVVRAIRKVKPDVVVTMDPSIIYSASRGIVNHPDHRAAGQAALDATYPLARDHLAFPELLKEGLQPHITPTVLLINFDDANFSVDVSNVFSKKVAALGAHKSQGLSTLQAIEKVTKLAEELGKEHGCELAECFVRIDIQN